MNDGLPRRTGRGIAGHAIEPPCQNRRPLQHSNLGQTAKYGAWTRPCYGSFALTGCCGVTADRRKLRWSPGPGASCRRCQPNFLIGAAIRRRKAPSRITHSAIRYTSATKPTAALNTAATPRHPLSNNSRPTFLLSVWARYCLITRGETGRRMNPGLGPKRHATPTIHLRDTTADGAAGVVHWGMSTRVKI